MASQRFARVPTCLNCLRQLTNPAPAALSPLSWTQVRGARTMTKAEEEDLQGIPVRLLQDVPGFGRKFAIIRVRPGRMRNVWHPKNVAEYMTKKRFGELGLTQAAVGVRDRTFGNKLLLEDKKKDAAKKKLVVEGPIAKKKEVLTLAPPEAHRLLSELLPDVLTFERKPIHSIAAPASEQPAAEPKSEPVVPRSPALAANAAVSSQAQNQETTSEAAEPASVAIFGSVSTNDVLAKVKDALLADQNGSRVALEAEGIKILGLDEGDDRIKQLGRFEVEIETGKGTVRRAVNVIPEE